jgi:hypothetical protein
MLQIKRSRSYQISGRAGKKIKAGPSFVIVFQGNPILKVYMSFTQHVYSIMYARSLQPRSTL